MNFNNDVNFLPKRVISEGLERNVPPKEIELSPNIL